LIQPHETIMPVLNMGMCFTAGHLVTVMFVTSTLRK